jgi:type IV secretion system protein VirB6
MGIVSWMVDTTDEFLDDAAQSQFGAVASNIGTILAVGSTLVLVVVLVNMALQYRSMDGRTAFGLAFKLVLISVFAMNWAQFNAVADAIIGGLDFIAGALVTSVGGGGAGASHFATEFDRMIDNFSQYLNAVGSNLNWMAGAMMGALGAFFLGVVGALCGLVLIFAKIMLTFMLGIAPVMIGLSLFEATKDYFHRWLSSTVSYALYPLVIAGVFSTIVGMAKSLFATLGDPNSATSIGALIPFFMMMFLAAGLIIAVPLMVKSLSGNFSVASLPSMSGSSAFVKGVMGTSGSRTRQARGIASNSELAGAALRQTPAAAKAVAQEAGQVVQRIADRARRLRE